MTSYTLLTNISNGNYRWDNAAQWSTGVVPNALDADVVVPDQPTSVGLNIFGGEAFTVRSLTQVGPYSTLYLAGALSVAGSAAIDDVELTGGSFSAGSLTGGLNGYGSVSVSGNLLITKDIEGYGTTVVTGGAGPPSFPTYTPVPSTLSITVGSLTNTSTLFAEGPAITVVVTVTGGPGAATNLVGNTLVGGSWYGAEGGVLDLNLGAVITTAAANVGDIATIYSYDSASGTYKPLSATLQAVAAGGSAIVSSQPFAPVTAFTIAAGGQFAVTNQSFTDSQAITDAGALRLLNATVTAQSGLDVTPGGTVSGSGTITGAIEDDGTITAAGSATRLILAGAVGGSGLLVVGYGAATSGTPSAATPTLELAGSTANTVQFLDGTGILQLDNPAGFSGILIPATPEFISSAGAVAHDQILLSGITAASVTGESFMAFAGGDTLTIVEGTAQQTLTFVGSFSAGSFALSAGPTLASGQPSLDVTVTPVPVAPTLAVAGSAAAKVITNSPAVSGTAAAGTAVTVAVDGIAAAVTTSTPVGATMIGFTATSAALTTGLHQVTATAGDAAGSASTAPLSLYELPTPLAGVTTADVSSFDIHQILGLGYSYQFISGTQEVKLTNGTLSVGTDTDAAYVQRLYEGLLGRAGDAQGLASFSASLAAGTDPVTIAGTFLSSGEYQALHGTQTDSQFVTGLFQGFLGRAPSAADLTGMTAQLAAGASRSNLAASIAISAEARTHLMADTSDLWVPSASGALITQLYQTALGRDPELTAVQADTQQLMAGLTPQALAQIIASSGEFQRDHNGQSTTAFVTSLYQAGLGRAPGAGELQGWVGQLQAGATPAAVTYGIATSAEATGRLSPTI